MIHVQSPFAHFDDRAKRVVEMTRQRAETLRSQVIGPEHLLLGLLAVRHGLAARAVTNLAGSAGSAAEVERVISDTLVAGPAPSPSHLRFTAICEQAIVHAAQQARLLGDDRIGTEHLLLGLFQVTENPGMQALAQLGVDYQAVQAEIARLRAQPDQP